MSSNDKNRKTRADRHKKQEVVDESTHEIDSEEDKGETRVERLRNRAQEKTKEVTEEVADTSEESSAEKRTRSSRRKGSLGSRLLKISLITALFLFVCGLIGYTVILYGGKLLVDEEKLMISPPTTIETSDGEIIWYLYDEFRLPVTIDQIPEHVQQAFISVEDKRFYEHIGIDIRAISRAIYRDIVAGSKVEGASTITQQLAKNIFLTNDKTWLRKTKEMMIALHLEREFSKEKILEMYLNVIYFGHGQYGIEAASNKFFMKSVEELTIEEGAILAGMIKAPNGNSPIDHPEKAKARRDIVLERMLEAEVITEAEMTAGKEKAIELNVTDRVFNPVYHSFVDFTIREAAAKYGLTIEELRSKRYRIVTSLDPDFQTVAYDEFQFESYFPGSNDMVEGAFVMIDQENGEVVATLGGRDFQVGDLNRANEKRQPGSTFKPIAVFAPALMTDNFDVYSVLPDVLQEWEGHEVKNVDDRYDGKVTFYDALKRSKNTSSTWLLNEIGIDYAKGYLEKMGMKLDPEDKDLAIALGGLEYGVTPVQMVQAFRTFIHEGEKVEAHAIKEIKNYKGTMIGSADTESVEVFSPQVAWTMTELLISTVESGTATSGEYNKQLAGKTGTTQHPRAPDKAKDAWFVGYTPEYVTALWMGFDKSNEENYLTGGSAYPTKLTKKILSEIDRKRTLTATFIKPDNVEAVVEPVALPTIDDLTGKYIFGGFKIFKGKLSWTTPLDKRVGYHIYKYENEESEKIGEVIGESEFIIENISLFQTDSYYVVPVDPLSGIEGEPSEVIQLSF